MKRIEPLDMTCYQKMLRIPWNAYKINKSTLEDQDSMEKLNDQADDNRSRPDKKPEPNVSCTDHEDRQGWIEKVTSCILTYVFSLFLCTENVQF